MVLGASPNPTRYSNLAAQRLQNNGHDTVLVGVRAGEIGDKTILLGQPEIEDIDTITLYMNPERQKPHYDYILGLQPKRIIFNPGTENPELIKLARERGIETTIACTLVMLSVGNY